MLSDEITTGGISTGDADKRAYAAKSHEWNMEQRKFREVFPDVRAVFLRVADVALTGGLSLTPYPL
jgi:ubiquitin-conjugating enzyme E2 J2